MQTTGVQLLTVYKSTLYPSLIHIIIIHSPVKPYSQHLAPAAPVGINDFFMTSCHSRFCISSGFLAAQVCRSRIQAAADIFHCSSGCYSDSRCRRSAYTACACFAREASGLSGTMLCLRSRRSGAGPSGSMPIFRASAGQACDAGSHKLS